MERITSKDLRRALEAHVAALEKVGIVYDGRLELEIGSKTNGIAYRLSLVNGGHGRPPVGEQRLGRTAREAYDALITRTSHVYDMKYCIECAHALERSGGVS